MTKRIVSGIFILTALGALGVILAGALTSGEQLIVRFLTAVIVAALGLYVISDLRLQADDDAMTARTGGQTRVDPIDAPPNSTAAFMATVTRKTDAPPTDFPLATGALEEEHLSAASTDGEAPSSVPSDERPPIYAEIPSAPAEHAAAFDAQEIDLLRASASEEINSGDIEEVPEESQQEVAAAGPEENTSPAQEQADVEEAVNEEELLQVVADAEAFEVDAEEQYSDHALASVGAVTPSADIAANGSGMNRTNGVAYSHLNGHRAPDTVREDFLSSASVDISDLFADHVSPSVSSTDLDADADAHSHTEIIPETDFDSWPNQIVETTAVTEDEPASDEIDADGGVDTPPASEFEYSDELASTEHVWPIAPANEAPANEVSLNEVSLNEVSANETPANSAPEPHPFEKASAAYEAAKRKVEQVDSPSSPTSLPVSSSGELEAASYADERSYADASLAPVIDLREIVGTEPDDVDRAIHAGEVEVVATLIEQGMLNTSGPISDREVRTMVYVAFTSNELRKLLIAGGSPDEPNYGLDLGPVELFDERRHTPAPKTLYSGIDHPQPKTKLG